MITNLNAVNGNNELGGQIRKLLMALLSVKKQTTSKPNTTILIVSNNTPAGLSVFFDLLIDLEKKTGKKVDQSRLTLTSVSSSKYEEVSRIIQLKIVNFVFFADQDEHNSSLYPELLEILPFS